MYDGDNLNFEANRKGGVVAYNELHVSDSNNVISFYEKIFNWQYVKDENAKTYQAYDVSENWITTIKEIPNTIKGKYEYWVITFYVSNINSTVQIVEKWGGAVVAKDGQRIMMTDNSGEAFFYLEEA